MQGGETRTPRRPLSRKLVLVVVAVTAVVLTAQSVSHLSRLREAERSVTEDRLALAADFYADEVAHLMAVMANDADVLAASAEVVRGLGALRDASEQGAREWRAAIESIFASELRRRPHYTQLRLIGQEDNWRELVRVNQSDGAQVAVPETSLQVKGGEPYLSNVAARSAQGSYFSEVTLNREHGRVEGAPTIRVVSPIRDIDGTLVAVVVINADFEALLRQVDIELSDGIGIQLLTGNGDYLQLGGGNDPVFRFHTNPDWQRPAHSWVIEGRAPGSAIWLPTGGAVLARPVTYPTGGQPLMLWTVAFSGGAAIFDLSEIAQRELLVGAAMVFAAGATSAMFGRRIVRPLRTLTDAITTRGSLPDDVPLDLSGDDEAAALARAFARMSDRLVEKTARATAVFEDAGSAIVVIDEDSVIQDANPAAEALFAYARADLVGRDLGTLMPPELAADHGDRVRNGITKRGPMAANREVAVLTSDGRRIPVEIWVSSARVRGRTLLFGILHDITERREAQDRERELIAALERSNAELDQFAYVASHDLKAPLRVIDNTSRWLAEDLEEHLTEDTRESLDFLRGRVARMEGLLNDLLEHSRIGRSEVAGRIVGGTELIEDVTSLLDIPPGFDLVVDPGFARVKVRLMPLKVVLVNLLSNAFTHHDRDTGRVEITVSESAGWLDITVADDGPGIPERYHDKVFEMFQTLKPRDEFDTRGMGLATVRKYLTLEGGTIRIESDGVRGTRFHLRWPNPLGAEDGERLAS
ncbi:PAS domain S-box protein [Rhodobacterales bacterium HKCCE2091]|nr:PAS domain S-box protein [Rhodobacterales bacterium HKCCE2091]